MATNAGSNTGLAHDVLVSMDEAKSGVAAAVNAGLAAAGPRELFDDDRFLTQLVPAGHTLKVIDREELEEKFRLRPRRKTGTVHVHTAASFIGYLEKHALPETEVWADVSKHKLVAVINAHEMVPQPGTSTAVDDDKGAGHGDHRVALELVQSPAWKAWLALDRKYVGQVDFANHLEDNALDIVRPDAATMLEIAESFQASTSVEFKAAHRLASGQVNLQYTENGGARAGEHGDIEIPTEFTISVAPFEGHDPYDLTARFRYRIRNGELALSYHLVRPDDVLRQAFLDYVDTVDNAIEAPVFRGRPE